MKIIWLPVQMLYHWATGDSLELKVTSFSRIHQDSENSQLHFYHIFIIEAFIFGSFFKVNRRFLAELNWRPDPLIVDIKIVLRAPLLCIGTKNTNRGSVMGLISWRGGGGWVGGFISLLVSSQLRAEGLLNQNTRGSIIFVKVTCGDL